MAVTPGTIFNKVAGMPEMIRGELALAANEAAALKAAARESHARDLKKAEKEREDKDRDARDDAMMAWYVMAAMVYRETQERLLEMFETDGEASRLALAAIDGQLADLERERAAMIEKAVKLDDGRAVFLSEDGMTIYTEDGEKLSDEEAERLLAERREELEAGERWEDFAERMEKRKALEAERGGLLAWERQRAEWQAKVESGELTQEQMEELERDYEASVPAAVKAKRAKVEEARLSMEEVGAPASQSTTLADGFNKFAEGAPADDAIDLALVPGEAARGPVQQALKR